MKNFVLVLTTIITISSCVSVDESAFYFDTENGRNYNYENELKLPPKKLSKLKTQYPDSIIYQKPDTLIRILGFGENLVFYNYTGKAKNINEINKTVKKLLKE